MRRKKCKREVQRCLKTSCLSYFCPVGASLLLSSYEPQGVTTTYLTKIKKCVIFGAFTEGTFMMSLKGISSPLTWVWWWRRHIGGRICPWPRRFLKGVLQPSAGHILPPMWQRHHQTQVKGEDMPCRWLKDPLKESPRPRAYPPARGLVF